MVTAGPIGVGTLARVLWRSFFLQSATNYERMQNVGFAYCLMPVLKRLYRGEALREAVDRHLAFFNTHPYMADAVLGAAIRLEVRVAAGEIEPEQVNTFKTCVAGPLAGIGDSFFWASLRPFAGALAVAGVFSGISWSPIVFLVLYNAFHLAIRVQGLWAGYELGEKVIERLYRVDLVRYSGRSHYLTGLCLGVCGALLSDAARSGPHAVGAGLEALLMLCLVLVFLQSIKRRIPMIALLYGSTLLTLVAVLGLNAAFPLF